jgi:SAM-dependent methyltransferase
VVTEARQRVVMSSAQAVEHRASWGRSLRLFRVFLVEQSDPDRFYSALASDSAVHVDSYRALAGATLLDVGGGPGFFARAFEDRGAVYFAVDADAGEMRLHGRQPGPRTVQASGEALPFGDDSFDVVYSSNVLEHVVDPWRLADEMVRVVKPGGIVAVSYTLWFGPWGGHETSPWHYLGGARAARIFQRRHGKPPKNVYGRSLFAVTAREGLAWARSLEGSGQATLVRAEARYVPVGLRWLVKVPLLREVLCWNVMLVLSKR